MAKLRKAWTVDKLFAKKFDRIPLTGRWRELLGHPESNGTWFVKGKSGHGKTTLLMELCKELTKYGKVNYNSLEEGARASMQDACRELKMDQCAKGRFQILHREPMNEMIQRLKMRNSADFVVIDSIQYAFMTTKEYKDMQSLLNKKLFIINSHQKGLLAVGKTAQDIEYDADVKIDVEGYIAKSVSRTSRGIKTRPFVIWEEGAQDYWNTLKL